LVVAELIGTIFIYASAGVVTIYTIQTAGGLTLLFNVLAVLALHPSLL